MAKTSELTLDSIYTCLTSLWQLNEDTYVIDVAKELGVKKTDFWQFINKPENKLHFKVKPHGKANKPAIFTFYRDELTNPNHPDYVAHMAELHRNDIYIYDVDDYGYVLGFAYKPSNGVWDEHEIPWRFTPEKETLVREHGLFGPVKFAKGGYGDGWTDEYDLAVRTENLPETIKKAIELGLNLVLRGGDKAKKIFNEAKEKVS